MSFVFASRLRQITLFVIPLLAGCFAGKHEEELGGQGAQREPGAILWTKWEANPEPYGGLKTLREIKRAKKAKASVLHLADRKIRDLSPLASLTDLEALYLGLNEIRDLSPLAGLSNLTYLNLYANRVSDVTPLSGLTGLDTLFLDRNKITKITPLAKLSKLEWLAVRENPLAKGEADAIRKALPDCELKD
jgi:Leucine-rich repeat (LRR) protein